MKEKEKLVIFNFKIDENLRDEFKIKTIQDKRTMTDVVISAIKDYLKGE